MRSGLGAAWLPSGVLIRRVVQDTTLREDILRDAAGEVSVIARHATLTSPLQFTLALINIVWMAINF